jgi:hypothetical protein
MELDRRLEELTRGMAKEAEPAPHAPAVNGIAAPSRDADVPASIPLVSRSSWLPPAVPAAENGVPTAPTTVNGSSNGSANGSSNGSSNGVAHAPTGAREDAATVVLAQAEEEAARILTRVHERADEVKDQIRELLGVRDQLRVSTREIMVTCGEALSALEQRCDTAVAMAGDSDVAAGEWPALDALAPVRRHYVGDVKVVAGPFRDLGAIRMLEDALAGIAAVESVSLAGFAHHNVHIDVRLGVECDLVAELEPVFPFAYEVESVPGADLTLRLRAG